MPNQKKSFVMYFDSLGLLNLFPPEQIGELLLALYDYAQRICDTEETPEEALFRYSRLDPATQVGFCSIAWHILRDTRTWKSRQTHCRQAAQERLRKQQAPQPAPQPAPSPTFPIRQESPRSPAPEPRQWEPRPAAEPQRPRQPYVPKRNSGYRPRESREEEMARYVRAFGEAYNARKQAQAAEKCMDYETPIEEIM